MARRKRGRSRRNRRRVPRGATPMKAMDQEAWQDYAERYSDVFKPHTHSVAHGVELLKEFFKRGGLDVSDDGLGASTYEGSGPLQKKVSGHFPGEETQLHHFVELLGLYNFAPGGSKKERDKVVEVGVGFIIDLMMTLKVFLGSEGGWIVWNALWEACDPEAAIDIEDKIAMLRAPSDEEEGKGWMNAFPMFDEVMFEALRRHVDLDKLQEAWSTELLQDSHWQVVAKALTRMHYTVGADWSPIQGEASSGGLFEKVVAKNHRTFARLDEDELAMQVFGPSGGAAVRGVGEWAANFEGLMNDGELGPPAQWPVPQEPKKKLDKLDPNQIFGAVRETKPRHRGEQPVRHVHHGLDISADKGSNVVAMASGEVIDFEKSMGPDDYDGQPGRASRGNFVKVRTQLLGDLYVDHEYFHLSKVGKSVKLGAKLSKADVLGQVGSTGNSSGPHLHVGVQVVRLDDEGRSKRRWHIDPEEVLLEGFTRAIVQSGVPLVNAPAVSGGVITLATAALGRYRGFGPEAQRRAQAQGGFIDDAISWGTTAVKDVKDGVEDASKWVGEALEDIAQWSAKAYKQVSAFVASPAMNSIISLTAQAFGVPAPAVASVIQANKEVANMLNKAAQKLDEGGDKKKVAAWLQNKATAKYFDSLVEQGVDKAQAKQLAKMFFKTAKTKGGYRPPGPQALGGKIGAAHRPDASADDVSFEPVYNDDDDDDQEVDG